MSKSLMRVVKALQELGLPAAPLEMPEQTRTAAQAAAAAGCALDQIVKSIIFEGQSGRLYLFLVAGGNLVDPGLAAALAGEELRRADPARLRAVTGFAIGGVAPFGHLAPLPAWADPRLADFAEVWAAAGTPRHILALSPEALLRASGARWAEFCRGPDVM